MLDVVNANYTPKASGETEYIRIEIDAEKTYTSTAFFAVRAIDKAGNVGDVSNIVSILVADGYRIKTQGTVDFQYSPAEDQDEDHVEEDVDLGKEEENTGLTKLAITLLCAAIAFVIMIMAVVARHV